MGVQRGTEVVWYRGVRYREVQRGYGTERWYGTEGIRYRGGTVQRGYGTERVRYREGTVQRGYGTERVRYREGTVQRGTVHWRHMLHMLILQKFGVPFRHYNVHPWPPQRSMDHHKSIIFSHAFLDSELPHYM